MALATDGKEGARHVREHDVRGYWLRVYAVMEAAAIEFDACTSEQAIRMLAAAGIVNPSCRTVAP